MTDEESRVKRDELRTLVARRLEEVIRAMNDAVGAWSALARAADMVADVHPPDSTERERAAGIAQLARERIETLKALIR